MKAMVLTVGTGRNVEHGIATSIKQNNPDYVIFLATEESKTTIQRVEKVIGKKLDNYEIKIIKNENDAVECYKVARDVIRELKAKGYEICVDFTSGTKAMTGGLVLAAVAEEAANLVYVMGERDKETGRVIPGTERVYAIPSPIEVLVDIKKRLITAMFNSYQFYDCLKIIEDLERQISSEKFEELNLNTLKLLVEAYYLWDRFRHKEAFDKLTKISSENLKEYVTNIETLNSNKEFLGKLVNTRSEKLLLIDIICNAERRIEEGRYDDAVARLYRAMELLGHIALKQKGIDVKNFYLIDLQALPIDTKDKYEKYAENGKLRLGLRASYELLRDLQYSIGEKFFSDKRLQDLLNWRKFWNLQNAFIQIQMN